MTLVAVTLDAARGAGEVTLDGWSVVRTKSLSGRSRLVATGRWSLIR
jgi:hypothetical protein